MDDKAHFGKYIATARDIESGMYRVHMVQMEQFAQMVAGLMAKHFDHRDPSWPYENNIMALIRSHQRPFALVNEYAAAHGLIRCDMPLIEQKLGAFVPLDAADEDAFVVNVGTPSMTDRVAAHNAQANQAEVAQRAAGAITLDLNIFDDDGNVVDGATADVTREQVSDIVDHASQLVLVRRDGGDTDAVMNELEEALVAASVIAEEDGDRFLMLNGVPVKSGDMATHNEYGAVQVGFDDDHGWHYRRFGYAGFGLDTNNLTAIKPAFTLDDEDDLPVAGVTHDGRNIYHCYHRDDEVLREFHFTLDSEVVHGEVMMVTEGQFDARDVPKEFISESKQPIEWVLAAMRDGWSPGGRADIDPNTVYAVVQEGGSSVEIYLHTFDNRTDAVKGRAECADGAYRTSEVVPVPRALADHPEFDAVVESILQSTLSFDYPAEETAKKPAKHKL